MGAAWALEQNPRTDLVARLEGPSGLVASFDERGRRLLVGGGQGLRVWDLQTLEPLTELLRLGQAPVAVGAFSADGRYVAAASGHILTVWDVDTGVAVVQLSYEQAVQALNFSHDKRLLAVAVGDQVEIVSLRRAGRVSVRVHDHEVYGAAFDASGRVLSVTTGESGGIRVMLKDGQQDDRGVWARAHLWDVKSGVDVLTPRPVSFLPPDARAKGLPVVTAALSASGKRLATFVVPDGLSVHDISGVPGTRPKGICYANVGDSVELKGTDWISQLSFLTEDLILLSGNGCNSSLVRVPDETTYVGAEQLSWAADLVEASPDGAYVMSLNLSGEVAVYSDHGRGMATFRLPESGKGLPRGSFSRENMFAVAFKGDSMTEVRKIVGE